MVPLGVFSTSCLLVLRMQVYLSRSSVSHCHKDYLFSPELFPHPVLTARPSQPIEGGPVTLTCETQLSPWKPDVQLQFCFFRDVQTLGSGCSSSPKLQIPIMWNEDSGSYWCQAATTRITKKSQRSQIHVQSECSKGQLL